MSFAFVGRMVQSLKGLYNGINPATLTGAIDVVIVQQEDGSFQCSPFHVRFGKLGVLRSREKVVDIELNGEPTDLQMKLGEAGEAFFVQELESEEEDNFPDYLATSPLPSSSLLFEEGVKELHRQGGDLVLSGKDPRSDSSIDDRKTTDKPRRRVFKKKKQKSSSGKSSSRSISLPEHMATEEGLFDMEVTNSSEDEEIIHHMFTSMSSPQIAAMDTQAGTTSHRRMSSYGSAGTFVTPFSDPETSPIGSPIGSRPCTPKSDTEVDKQHTEESQNSALMETSSTWQWGEFPQHEPQSPSSFDHLDRRLDHCEKDSKKLQGFSPSSGFMSMWTTGSAGANRAKLSKGKDVAEGIYLDDLTSDPEMAKIYLGRPNEKEDDVESGRGTSLPQSPNSVEGAVGGPVSFTASEVRHLGPVSLSLCGGLNDPDGITLDKFMQKVVTFDDLAASPNITTHPDLVVKIHDKFYNWTTAGPMVLSQIVFHKQLPEPAVTDLEKEHMPKKEKKKKKSGWFTWGRSDEPDAADGKKGGTEEVGGTTTLASSASTTTLIDVESKDEADANAIPVVASPPESPPSSPPNSTSGTPKKDMIELRARRPTEEGGGATSTETDTDTSEKEASKSPPVTLMTDPSQQLSVDTCMPAAKKKEKYIKTLRLSSQQISQMKLKDGHNEMTFSVTTQYQGTSKCVAHVFLWKYHDKIVISDIDGTITRSDALGHILPIIGQDWSQSGVAQLFTRIHENGYKLIYLSARAIGQSRSTKDMLKSIRQGDLVLPDGPMFLNPTSLFSALHREVIVKKPEEFKISCLKDIAALFPASPFYAGFGNKVNDVIAYRALDIPKFRIFTINPKGQLRHDLSLTFLSSYSGMSDIADHFFPSLDQVDRGTNVEYNPVNYWRSPIMLLTTDELTAITIEEEPETVSK